MKLTELLCFDRSIADIMLVPNSQKYIENG